MAYRKYTLIEKYRFQIWKKHRLFALHAKEVKGLITKKILGDKIRILREKKGYTQKELARLLPHSVYRGMYTGAAVCKWETGENDMPLSVFIAICQILRADANELLELNPLNIDKK